MRWIINLIITFQSICNFGIRFIFNYLFRILFALFWSFVFCYFATRTTNRISSIGKAVYNSNWYNYPPEVQKCMILILLRSQRPSHFTGFNLFRCNLKIFRKVSSFVLATFTTKVFFSQKSIFNFTYSITKFSLFSTVLRIDLCLLFGVLHIQSPLNCFQLENHPRIRFN